MKYIEDLQWRYATKKFDADRKVSSEDIDHIKKAIQLAASSYGLQFYKVLIITDEDIRKQLLPHSWNQGQIVDASHIFVFCRYTEVSRAEVQDFISMKERKLQVEPASMSGYTEFISTKLSEVDADTLDHWTAKQTYIALSNLLSACASLRIDSCPIEGFDSDQYDGILKLREQGLASTVVAAVGYRSPEDNNQHIPKVRRNMEDLFIEI